MNREDKYILIHALNKVIRDGVPKKYKTLIKYNLGVGDSSAMEIEKTGTSQNPAYIIISLKQGANFVIDPLKKVYFAHVPIGADENAAFKKACAEASAYIQKL